MQKVYFGEFSDWTDVSESFSHIDWSFDGTYEQRLERAKRAIPQPDEVIFAGYDVPGYEGYARVVYRNGDRYFQVTGSHCSCYGLEGQWEPEEYDLDTLIAAVEQERVYGKVEEEWKAAILQNLRSSR